MVGIPGQMFDNFDSTPVIKTEPSYKCYVTFNDGEIDSIDDDTDEYEANDDDEFLEYE